MKGRRLVVVAVVVALLMGCNTFWSNFVEKERTLYAWDHVAYWSLTASLAGGLRTDPVAALANVGRSLAEDELNLLPTMPLAPWLMLFGRSRATWILTILNVYLLPALLLGWWVLMRWGGTREQPWDPMTAGAVWLATVLLFAPLWEPLALGYLDAGGLIVAFAVLGLALGKLPDTPTERRVIDVATGGLIAVLLLFRRWYAFWSVSFCLVVAVVVIIAALTARRRSSSAREPILRGLFIGGAAVLTLGALAGPRIMTMIRTDYGDRFIHYKSLSSPGAELTAVVQHFGLLTLGLTAAGLLMLLSMRGDRWRAASIVLQLMVIALLFRRVQDPSPQHWYLLVPGLMILCAGGWTAVLIGLQGWKKHAALAALVVIGGTVTASVFGNLGRDGVAMMPAVRIEPKVRRDLGEFKRLMRWLDGRVDLGAQWVYVLAATGPVSDSSLGFTNFSLETRFQSPAHVLMTQQVDRRDGFPNGLFEADIVIVPEPVAVRGDGDTQQVVAIPARQFLDGAGVAAAFVHLPEVFRFDGGVTAHVFERVRPNTHEEIQYFSERLRAVYPDRPEIWEPSS